MIGMRDDGTEVDDRDSRKDGCLPGDRFSALIPIDVVIGLIDQSLEGLIEYKRIPATRARSKP